MYTMCNIYIYTHTFCIYNQDRISTYKGIQWDYRYIGIAWDGGIISWIMRWVYLHTKGLYDISKTRSVILREYPGLFMNS